MCSPRFIGCLGSIQPQRCPIVMGGRCTCSTIESRLASCSEAASPGIRAPLDLEAGQTRRRSTSMGWERGYYYRVRKVRGKVVREYVGGGLIGELSAQIDADRRALREEQQAALRAAKAELAG